MKIKVEKTRPHGLPAPSQATESSAGYDLQSEDDFFIPSGNRAVIGTGYKMEIPQGFAGFIWPRSGMAVKQGAHIMAGLIDSDYRGEIKVCICNLGPEPIRIEKGDRIAQLVIGPVLHSEIELVESLEDTARGDGGFGSTGK